MSEPLIDTHCHLVLLDQRGLLNRALEGAAAAGVETVVSVGVDLEDSERNCEIAEGHPNVWFTVGWDPQQRQPPDAAQRAALAELVQHPRAVAVGEVGLDLFFRPGYHETPLEVQQRSLLTMLELAAEYDKPVVIHDRDAHDEIIAELARVPDVHGLMHCFTAGPAHMRRCVERGFAVSFAGIVTFPRAGEIAQAAVEVPADAYVVETDAPFLTPVPHRGTVNLPERVADTAARIAALRGEPVRDVRRQTTATARRVLRLPEPG